MTEKRTLKMSKLEMDCYSQNGRSLEEYVEEFLEHYHNACWDNETLKQLFWNIMDGIISQMLLLREDHLPFIEFIDYALWIADLPSPWESLRKTPTSTLTF